MRVYIDNNKLVIIVESKTISFNLTKKVVNSLKNEIKLIISRNESFDEYAIKNEISQFLFKHKHGHKKQWSETIDEERV